MGFHVQMEYEHRAARIYFFQRGLVNSLTSVRSALPITTQSLYLAVAGKVLDAFYRFGAVFGGPDNDVQATSNLLRCRSQSQ